MALKTKQGPQRFSKLSLRFRSLKMRLLSGPPGFLRLSVLYQQIGLMTQVGFSIVYAFEVLSVQEENLLVKRALRAIGEKMRQGSSPAEACRAYPFLFPESVRMLVRMAEETGDLPKKFLAAGELFKRKHEMEARWKEAVRGPVITSIFFLTFIIGVVKFILPRFVALYSELPIQPSLFTKTLFSLVRLVNVPFLFLLVFGIGFLVWRYRKKLKKRLFDWGLEIPLVRKFIGKMLGAQFADSVASLYRNGVIVPTSLEILARTSTPEFYSQDLGASLSALRKGATLPHAISRITYFPKAIGQMLAIGEQTGKLDKLLSAIAKYMEEDCRYAMLQAAAVVEPAAMAFLGGMMAVVFIGLLLPLYQLISHISL